MSGLDWQAPDFLSNTSGDDYLASLASFLDGSESKYHQNQPDLSVYGLGTLPSLSSGGLTGGDVSSPELTSDSGASPSSSDGLNNPSVPAPQYTNNSNASSRRSTTSSAIPSGSSHEQPKPHDKRKGGPQATQAIKDRRSSSGKANVAPHHSHPDGVEGEVTRSASPEDDGADGKKGGKKTSEKRKAQNRAAQRNFRERKEKHLKDLEDKVGLLEQKANDSAAENSALKQLLEQLKSENDRLKVFESAFSFSYDKDVNNSSTMPTSSTFEGGNSRPSLPGRSSSSSNNDISPNTSFSFENSSFELPTSHADTSYTSSSFPNYPISTSVAPGAGGIFPDNLFLNSLTVPPNPIASSSSESPISPSAVTHASSASTRSSSTSYVTTPPTGTGPDLFASYRDPLADLSLPSAPLATLGDFDQLFGTNPGSISGGGGGEGGQDSMSQFIKSPSPLDDSLLLSTPPSSSSSLLQKSEVEGKKVTIAGEAGCPYGLIQGEKYEFDLDNLCAEMKMKATCQEAARQALASAMAEDAQISRSAYPAQL